MKIRIKDSIGHFAHALCLCIIRNFLIPAATQTLLASLESLRLKQFGLSVTFRQCCIVKAELANNWCNSD